MCDRAFDKFVGLRSQRASLSRLAGNKKGGREASLSYAFLFRDHRSVLQHDGQEREQHEGFNQRQAQQQHREDAASRARIASGPFAGRGNRAAVAKRSAQGCDSYSKRAHRREEPGIASRVIGSSGWVANRFITFEGNGDLALNAVNWLSSDEDLISIRPKQQEDRRITLTRSQMSWVRATSQFLLPALVVIAGVFVWLKRR